jgi:hypothetical protein
MVLVIGSSIDPSALRGYSKTIRFGERVAQSVEHLTFNQEVAGSIPAALTNEINLLDAHELGSLARAMRLCRHRVGTQERFVGAGSWRGRSRSLRRTPSAVSLSGR